MNWTVIKTFNPRHEAGVSKGLLEANGIKCIISADDEGGLAQFPFQPSFTGVRLLVEKSNETKAHELFRA